jgi:hypothetical protein
MKEILEKEYEKMHKKGSSPRALQNYRRTEVVCHSKISAGIHFRLPGKRLIHTTFIATR